MPRPRDPSTWLYPEAACVVEEAARLQAVNGRMQKSVKKIELGPCELKLHPEED